MLFNKRLKEERKKRRITQKELGSVLGYCSTAIANYESGRNQPNIDDLIKIANYLDLSLDYLMGREEDLLEAMNLRKTVKMNEILGLVELMDRLSEDEMREIIRYAKWRYNSEGKRKKDIRTLSKVE